MYVSEQRSLVIPSLMLCQEGVGQINYQTPLVRLVMFGYYTKSANMGTWNKVRVEWTDDTAVGNFLSYVSTGPLLQGAASHSTCSSWLAAKALGDS